MIRNLKIKFVLIIMLLLTIVLTTLLAGLFMYQKNQLYVDSVSAMKEAMVLQADTQSSLYYELFGLYSRSSRYPYFNTFVLEVDRIDKTVTAIGYEEELDDEKKEYLLSLVNAVPAVNKAEGILPAENLRYYVNTTSRGMKIAFLDKEYEDASLRDLMKNARAENAADRDFRQYGYRAGQPRLHGGGAGKVARLYPAGNRADDQTHQRDALSCQA